MPSPILTRYETHYGARLVRCYVERPSHIDAMFQAAVARAPQRAAVIEDDGQVIAYAPFARQVDAIAGNLAAAGLGSGDRIAIVLGNRAAFLQLVLACCRLGAIAVPIGTRQRKPELAFMLAQCGAKMLAIEASLAAEIPDAQDVPRLERIYAVAGAIAGGRAFEDLLALPPAPPPPCPVREDDTAFILYTSGTTGRPKGAMLSHFGVIQSCIHFETIYDLRDGDRTILAVPASHVTGLVAVLLSLVRIAGTTALMLEFKAKDFLARAETTAMTYGILVPAMYNLCLLQPDLARYRLGQWRIGAFGGAPMPESTITAFGAAFPNLILCNSYGATETTSPTSLMPLGMGPTHLDTVGKVVTCGEVRIMDEAGRELAPGAPGEIWIAGPMVVAGYWDNPAANAANFVAGFWKSGDIGSLDGEGYLRVLDRRKDMINRAGFKVYSVEVENVLAQHPAVIESAVIGHPDAVLGERVQAVVVAHPGSFDAAALRAFCAQRLADYKVPELIAPLDRPLPRNANGKVAKNELRRLLADGS